MRADRERRVAVVGEHLAPSRSGRAAPAPPRSARSAARAGGRRRRALSPRGVMPRRQSRSRRGPHSSQAPAATSASSAPLRRRAAAGEVADVGVGLLGDERGGRLLADRADVAEPDPDRALLDRAADAASVHVRRPHLDARAGSRRARARRAGRSPSAGRSGARRGTRRGSSGAPRPTGRRAARRRRRATWGSRSPRSRRACRRSRARSAASIPLPRQPSTKRGRNASIASSLRLRLIARRSPSASPTLKPGRRHRDVEHLVLEDDDAERLGERLAQRLVLDRVDEARILAPALAPLDVGVDGLALDRPRADERDLHRQVVEVLGPRPQQALHLGAALDLEQPHRVGLLDLGVHLRVVERDAREVDRLAGGAGRSGRPPPRSPRASPGRAGRS